MTRRGRFPSTGLLVLGGPVSPRVAPGARRIIAAALIVSPRSPVAFDGSAAGAAGYVRMAPMRGLSIGGCRAAGGDGVAGDGVLGEASTTRQHHGVALTAVACLYAALILGCGASAQKHEAQRLENASILSGTAPLDKRLVKQSEIESASDSAAQRSFLQLWSLLQFGAWDQAEGLFQPGLRDTIGASLLAQALAQNLIIWQATKPRIVSARATGTTAVVSFLARDEKDSVVPASISFQRSRGVWLVSYFSPLDGAIQRAVQLRLQAQIDPLATKPSAEAVRQGDSAARLQSTYLERQLRATAKRGRGGGGAGR